MALPYFSAIWIWNYYQDMMEQAGFDAPFSTYDELIEQCVKAKQDGIAQYPILWVAGVGLEQLPGTWYSLTWNQGGTFFDKDGNHQLGDGSIARETLKWWANTFEQGLDIADPELLKVQFTSSAKAFGAGHNLYRGPNHHYGLNIVNDPAQSPIAGKVKAHGFPGDGATIGVTHVYFLTPPTATRSGPGSCCSISAARTRPASTPRPRPRARRDARQRLSVGDGERRGDSRAGSPGAIRSSCSRCGARRPTSASRSRRSISPGISPGPTSSTSRSRNA